MRQAIFLLAVAIVTVPPLLQAQQPEEVPPPKPPFVRPPPERSAWTIKVTRPEEAPDPQAAQAGRKPQVVVAIASVRYGESKRDVVYYSNGSKKEFWFVGQHAFWPYPDGSRVGVGSPDVDALVEEPVSSPSFPGLDWLSADAYKDVVEVGKEKTKCRHYVRNSEGDAWEAWIGLESGLPVAAKFGAVGHIYAFTAPPTAPLQMPAMYAKALEEVKKQAARAAALAEKFSRR